MAPTKVSLSRLAGDGSFDVGVGDWMALEQSQVDDFAELTGDRQWIHVDSERAAREAPGGTTIAHGYFTLSVAAAQVQELLEITGASRRVNYGVEKVRFLTPVPVGARFRCRVRVTGAESRPSGVLYRLSLTVELEGQERPAMVAEALGLAVADGVDPLTS